MKKSQCHKCNRVIICEHKQVCDCVYDCKCISTFNKMLIVLGILVIVYILFKWI